MANLRALLVGLDGADFELVRELMENGDMPFLAKLSGSGVTQSLRSTIPPITPTAWNSIYTGANPGKHGVFDFSAGPRPGTARINTSLDRNATPFWTYLNESGLKTVLVNMPMCYPPETVDGIMVSGFGGPERPGIAPEALAEQFDRLFPGYVTFCHPLKNRYWEDFPAYVEKLKQLSTQQVETTVRLTQMLEPELSMVVLPSSDTICHLGYHLHDPAHPAHIPGSDSPIVEVYRHIDGEVERLVNETGDEETAVIVLSDHGSKPIYQVFAVNQWLERAGYLAFNGKQLRNLKGVGRLPRNLKSGYRRLAERVDRSAPSGWRRRLTDLVPRNLFKGPYRSFRSIDWSRTTAYGRGTYGQLWLNDSIHEAQREAVLARLKADFEAFTVDGAPLFDVRRREDLYFGPHLLAAPDVYLSERASTIVPSNRLDYKRADPILRRLEVLDPARDYGYSGWHGRDGVLIAAGGQFGTGNATTKETATVLDIAPTLLHLFGLTVPPYMDGRILEELLVPAATSAATGKSTRASGQVRTTRRKSPTINEALTTEQEQEIVEHLRELGYL